MMTPMRFPRFLVPVFFFVFWTGNTAFAQLPPEETHTFLDTGTETVQLRVAKPEGWSAEDTRPVVFYQLGGGWWKGGGIELDTFAYHWRDQGCVVVMADYRKAEKDGQAPVPGRTIEELCIPDTKSAIRWVRERADELGIDPDKLIGMGISAGATNIWNAVLLDNDTYNNPGDDLSISPKPNLLVLINPVTDLTYGMAYDPKSGPGYGTLYTNDPASISPAHAMAGHTVPALLMYAEDDGFFYGGGNYAPEILGEYQASLPEYGGTDITLKTVPEGGHLFHRSPEGEARVIRWMRDFVAKDDRFGILPLTEVPIDGRLVDYNFAIADYKGEWGQFGQSEVVVDETGEYTKNWGGQLYNNGYMQWRPLHARERLAHAVVYYTGFPNTTAVDLRGATVTTEFVSGSDDNSVHLAVHYIDPATGEKKWAVSDQSIEATAPSTWDLPGAFTFRNPDGKNLFEPVNTWSPVDSDSVLQSTLHIGYYNWITGNWLAGNTVGLRQFVLIAAPDGGDPGNRRPVGTADAVSLAEDSAVTVDVLANDFDPDAGDTLSLHSFDQPGNGTVADNADGTLTYTPILDYSGSDAFKYYLADDDGAIGSAVVSVTISDVDDPPVAVADSAYLLTEETSTIPVMENDLHPDPEDTLDIIGVTQGNHGTVIIDSGEGTVRYTPSAGYTGVDCFTYTIEDGNGNSDTAMVTVAVQAETVLLEDTFTTDTRADWEFLAEGTEGTPSEEYIPPGSSVDGFTGHDGVLWTKGVHTGTSSSQAALHYRTFPETDISLMSVGTTGIHSGSTETKVRLAVAFDVGSGMQWAVSDQSIATSDDDSTPVAGLWTMDQFTFVALDPTDLLTQGLPVDSGSVLRHAVGGRRLQHAGEQRLEPQQFRPGGFLLVIRRRAHRRSGRSAQVLFPAFVERRLRWRIGTELVRPRRLQLPSRIFLRLADLGGCGRRIQRCGSEHLP